MDTQLRSDLVTANQIMAEEEIIRGFGHVSVRAPDEDDAMYISRSISPAQVTEDDIIKMSFDGDVLSDDDVNPYKETVIHRAIYRARDDVNAVVHHHADDVMPFTISDVEIRPAFHNGAPFRRGVPLFNDLDDEYGKLVVSEEEGERLAENLGDCYAQLIHAHGANVVGPGLKEAVILTVFFVMNARYQFDALQLTDSPRYYDESDESFQSMVDDVLFAPVVIDRKWRYLKEKLE